MIEDSPQRLVLETAWTRWIPAAVLFVLGLATAAGWWLDGREVWFLVALAALFFAGGAFFALSRQRWTFDAAGGTVRFDSLLWGAWEARLSSVTELAMTTRKHGPAGKETYVTALMMSVEGRVKPARVNASTDTQFIRDQKERIERMIEPWRRFGVRPETLP